MVRAPRLTWKGASHRIRALLMARLRELRRSRGLTQVQAARWFGVSQPRISYLAQNRTDRFTTDTLINMLAHAGIRLSLTFEAPLNDGGRRMAPEYSRRVRVMAAEFVTTIKANEIPVGGITAFDVRGTRIAVANIGGTYYAFDDACTHEQCSLAEEGELAGTTLTCTCHGSEFDVRTGNVLAPPATLPVKAYRTRVEGDALQIEV